MGLLGEVLDVEGRHRAAKADMHLVDLALGLGDDADTLKAHLLVKASDVLLVAREAVQGLGHHDVEAASHGGLPQTLKSGTQIEGPAARPILERLRHQPAIVGAQLAAEPKLVLDRGIPLQIGGIAGVEGRPDRR